MTSFREQAGFDTSAASDYGRDLKKLYDYAVAQREATLKLEDALRKIDAGGKVDSQAIARAALNAVKEG